LAAAGVEQNGQRQRPVSFSFEVAQLLRFAVFRDFKLRSFQVADQVFILALYCAVEIDEANLSPDCPDPLLGGRGFAGQHGKE
jgi:hypothetical protein